MKIIPNGSRPSASAPAHYFTGAVRFDPVIAAPDPARHQALLVTFEPGARTHWHTHPLGQTLRILSGVGRVQVRGEAVRQVGPGDTIWFPPGEEHWHGAAPDCAMVHLAIQEALDGETADWLEPVSDSDYGATP
ncbi:(R)-mandelonitrile lyase [Frigidibacter sp. ROC022]|uniref:(R)-mandelonitrile lyase n=1 Tax=Frigidibacter sp. ROC022 TaxID=2971796 RepID=UPI00215B631B|nr:cupin domain-containing protein [Frigidibacter sp. ROC022]MCR8726590.1 cupin domain-containing protein [Frigidibacter sp. ROC022]